MSDESVAPKKGGTESIKYVQPTSWADAFLLTFMGVTWVFGIAIAKTGWMTFFAIFPPVAWVIDAQYLLHHVTITCFK